MRHELWRLRLGDLATFDFETVLRSVMSAKNWDFYRCNNNASTDLRTNALPTTSSDGRTRGRKVENELEIDFDNNKRLTTTTKRGHLELRNLYSLKLLRIVWFVQAVVSFIFRKTQISDFTKVLLQLFRQLLVNFNLFIFKKTTPFSSLLFLPNFCGLFLFKL